ncbi:DNA repair protein RecN [hydrothermal vent metagenome]|uniref:DNA repair protein RecN n=1 Tax=hydrothermal vent metagenome TaxID=652676 RepID=A0A1W1CEN5_9ZZZZ
MSEVDIENVLDRLEKISALKRRYGSIEEALEYVELKKEELKGYENIEQDKTLLESFLQMEYSELIILANRISNNRKKHALILEKSLKEYLNELKLPPISFIFTKISLDILGEDFVSIDLNGSNAETLSGGEFNRVRLALMVVALSGVRDGGVLILDEIEKIDEIARIIAGEKMNMEALSFAKKLLS